MQSDKRMKKGLQTPKGGKGKQPSKGHQPLKGGKPPKPEPAPSTSTADKTEYLTLDAGEFMQHWRFLPGGRVSINAEKTIAYIERKREDQRNGIPTGPKVSTKGLTT